MVRLLLQRPIHGSTMVGTRTRSHGACEFDHRPRTDLTCQKAATGQRLLDISVCTHPQGGQYGNDTSTAMQQLRNRSTRALDPSYVDES